MDRFKNGENPYEARIRSVENQMDRHKNETLYSTNSIHEIIDGLQKVISDSGQQTEATQQLFLAHQKKRIQNVITDFGDISIDKIKAMMAELDSQKNKMKAMSDELDQLQTENL